LRGRFDKVSCQASHVFHQTKPQIADSDEYSYNIARMRYEIVLAPEAVVDLKELEASLRSEVKDALERHLRHDPTKVSKSRIKRLKGLTRPQYRLRVGEVRVFYDVVEDTVEILAIIEKSNADGWLKGHGAK
jgi:mRNA interferase RelE/StbE